MQISRRDALMGAGAAAVVAGVPGAVRAGKLPLNNVKTREALELFGQLNPTRQDISITMMQSILKVQRANERNGFTAADDARRTRDLERELAGMRS